MHPLDLEAARLGREQHGVFTVDQVLRHGTRRQIHYRATTGRWIDLGRNVYALPGAPNTRLHLYKAAEISMPRAAVSGLAAAALHELRPGPWPQPEISVHPPGTHEHPFATVRRRHDLRTQRVQGIRVTTIAQTICDLIGRVPIAEIESMIEVNVLTGLTSLRALGNRHRAMVRHHLPYRRVCGDILAERTRVIDRATSMLEARLVELLLPLDLPQWTTQHRLDWWLDGAGRADVAIPSWRVLIEADGRRWHGRLEDFDRDRRRDQLAAANGWIVLRFSWNEIVHDSAHVIAVILATGRHRSAG